MARLVFYYHLKRLKAKDKYASGKEMIKSIFHAHKGRYGYRRVTAEMRNNDVVLNHKTVQRLMGQMGLRSQIRKVRYRSYKGAVGRIAPNIINRDFAASAPNRKWATDVTQINIGPEKLYLSPILDMFNGEIISYNISRSPNLEQIYDMLDKAFARFDCLDGLILHSDQGWQYQHSIGDWAFDGCTSLSNLVIPDSVTSIGDGAFKICSSLTSISIPSSVTSIERNAFEDCSSLTCIDIPNSVTSIMGCAFLNCI